MSVWLTQPPQHSLNTYTQYHLVLALTAVQLRKNQVFVRQAQTALITGGRSLLQVGLLALEIMVEFLVLPRMVIWSMVHTTPTMSSGLVMTLICATASSSMLKLVSMHMLPQHSSRTWLAAGDLLMQLTNSCHPAHQVGAAKVPFPAWAILLFLWVL